VSVKKYQLNLPNIPDNKSSRVLLELGVTKFKFGGNRLKIQHVIVVENNTNGDRLTTIVICKN
jgi:hypothetical protein